MSNLLRIQNYGYFKQVPVGNYRLKLDPGDLNDRFYYFSLSGQGYSTLVSRILRSGDCVIDVGANVGHFAMTCAPLVGSLGLVHAIEANRALAERLRTSVADVPGNPIRVHQVALWSKVTELEFNIATVSGWSSLSRNETFQLAQVVRVAATTLDEFVSEHCIDHARLLKLDIEGAELDALLGGLRFLEGRKAEYILVEAEPHRLRAFGHTGKQITEMMNEHGYRPVCCIDSERIVPTSEARAPGDFNGDYLYTLAERFDQAMRSVFP